MAIYPGELSVDDVLLSVRNMNGHGGSIIYLLGGESRNDCGHTVVCQDDRIVWDPSIDKSGIVGPSPIKFKDGSGMTGYHVTFIGHAVCRPGRIK